MIEAKDIKKMVDDVIKRQRGVRDREPMDPAREWLTGFLITIIFVCMGGVVSYRYYSSTIAYEVAMSGMAVSPVPYDPVRIEDALNSYEERDRMYGQLRGSIPVEPVSSIVIPVIDEEETATSTATTSVDVTPAIEVSAPSEEVTVTPELGV